jgi:PAS domain S-box-containing protein
METPAATDELREILHGIPGLVAILTPAGEVTAANRQLVAYTGRALDELRQWGTSDTVHPEDLPRVIEIFSTAMASGEPSEWEARLRRFDGVYHWFQIRGRPVRDPQHQTIVRWYVLLSDIDDLKRIQEALRREEAFLATVQHVSATGGFYWWPVTGRSVWTEQVYRIFELDPTGPITMELRQSRIHPDDLPAHREAIQRAIREERDFEYEVRLLMPDKRVKYVHSLAKAGRDAEGISSMWARFRT